MEVLPETSQKMNTMFSDDRIRRKKAVKQPLLILGASMTLIYLGLGAWLFLDKNFLPGIQTEFRNIFATMLLVYGFFRGWRFWQDYRAH
jgi:hypothetical protein